MLSFRDLEKLQNLKDKIEAENYTKKDYSEYLRILGKAGYDKDEIKRAAKRQRIQTSNQSSLLFFLLGVGTALLLMNLERK